MWGYVSRLFEKKVPLSSGSRGFGENIFDEKDVEDLRSKRRTKKGATSAQTEPKTLSAPI